MTAFEHRVAVVTGGASGIGAAVVRHLAGAGWRVVIADVADDKAAEMISASEHCNMLEYRHLNVTDEQAVARCAEDVEHGFGPVAALVNSAGILQGAVRAMDMEMAQYETIMQVNQRGALLCSRAFASPMASRGRGAIVNICSIAGLRPGPQPAYAMSKSGLKVLTEILAAELGPSGVRVNAVAPGYTLTPHMQDLIARGERNANAAISASALRRMVLPEEVADGIGFLCSDQAAAITGVTLPIDCGWLITSAYSAFATQPH